MDGTKKLPELAVELLFAGGAATPYTTQNVKVVKSPRSRTALAHGTLPLSKRFYVQGSLVFEFAQCRERLGSNRKRHWLFDRRNICVLGFIICLLVCSSNMSSQLTWGDVVCFYIRSPSHVLSSPCFSLSILVVTEIRDQVAGFPPPSPLRFVPCLVIAGSPQPFLSSSTSAEL